MAYIPSILKKYCPNGVEFKTLGEITTEIKVIRNEIDKDLIGSGSDPVIYFNDIYENIFLEKPISFIDEGLIKEGKKYCCCGDVVLISAGKQTETGKACAYLGKEICLAGDKLAILKHSQNPLYLAFALSLRNVEDQKEKLEINFSSLSRLIKDNIKKIKIPLPPLEIQNKISDSLRHLWNLNKQTKIKIKRIIEIKEKQFEFYKEKLFEGLQEFKTLGEITTEIKSSSWGAGKNLIDSGNSPAVFIYDVFENIFLEKPISFIDEGLIERKVYCCSGDVVLIRQSFLNNVENILKSCAYLGSERVLVADGMAILKHSQNPLYLAFALSLKSVEEQKQKLISGVTFASLTIDNIKKIKIPLPPLEIQNKISDSLRHLWNLNRQTKEKLEKELETREKLFESIKESLFDMSEQP